MVGQLVRNWWIPVVRGVVGILFGFLVFAYPRTAVEVFVYLFGAYALVDGVIALALAFDVSVHSIEHEQAVVYEQALRRGQGVIAVHAPKAEARAAHHGGPQR